MHTFNSHGVPEMMMKLGVKRACTARTECAVQNHQLLDYRV